MVSVVRIVLDALYFIRYPKSCRNLGLRAQPAVGAEKSVQHSTVQYSVFENFISTFLSSHGPKCGSVREVPLHPVDYYSSARYTSDVSRRLTGDMRAR